MDGSNFVHYIYGQLFEKGLPVCCNPTCLYEETIKYIKLLRHLGLRVKKVFVESISNLDRMEEYLERRKEKDKIHESFWNSLVGDKTFTPKKKKKSCVSTPSCARDAILRAFMDQYGKDIVCLGGINSDRYYSFVFLTSLVILLITLINTMQSFLQTIVISVSLTWRGLLFWVYSH